MNNFNFNIWYETYDPIFTDISYKSLLPEKWINYKFVTQEKYKNSIIKPINRYVEFLYPAPKLISIDNNAVVLQQKTHADIFLLENKDGFRNVDRPHMRQYYQTKMIFDKRSDVFDPVYLFYAPWFIDEAVDVFFSESKDSPFEIYPYNASYQKISDNAEYIEPYFIPFRFKKTGNHIEEPGFGKILRGSPMFDISFRASDIIINRIRNFYEKN